MYRNVREFIDTWPIEDPLYLMVTDGSLTYIFENEDIDFIEEDILERGIEEFNLIHDPDKQLTTVRIILKKDE